MTISTERTGREGSSARIRVLWIGDPGVSADLSPAALQEAADGIGVVVEENTDVLERIREGRVDCVVSDHCPPAIDGIELLEAVRERRPDLPVFLAPSDGDEEVASRAVAADVSGYIPPETDGAVDRLAEGIRERTNADGVTDWTPILGMGAVQGHRLKERAIDQAPIGITIADVDRADEPLVYVNDAFEEITGYDKTEALGENCRFLQGPDTDPEQVARLREALEREDPVTVELRNYRKDGTPFWNRVDLAPITDGDGEVSHFAGFQTDITELKRVRRLLEEERRNLQGLVERVDGLVSDLSDVLVQAETESDVFNLVTRRLGTGTEYVAAWMGEHDRSRSTVTPVEWAGGGVAATGTVALDSETPTARLISSVVDAGTVDVVDVPERFDPPIEGPGSADRCAVVPVTYRDVTYGVVVVYGRSEEAFDEHERAVLSSLGQMIGGAINAIRSKRVALTDVSIEATVEITDTDLPFATLAAELGATFEFESALRRPNGDWNVLFAVDCDDPERLTSMATGMDVVADAEHLVERDGVSIVQFVVSTTDLTRIVTEHGLRLTEISVGERSLKVGVEAGREDAVRSAMRELEDTYDSVSLVEYHESSQFERRHQGFQEAVEERLTDRQLAALRKAYTAGFFEWPRNVEGEVLAESMDIVPSTFHQHLRAAERKLLSEFFES